MIRSVSARSFLQIFNSAAPVGADIAYKKNVEDTRESSPVSLMEGIDDPGAAIRMVRCFEDARAQCCLSSVTFTEESVASFDCIVLAADHDGFDYDLSGTAPSSWSVPWTIS